MQATVPLPADDTSQPTRGRLWTARVTTGLAGAFLLFDAAMKLAMPASVAQASVQLGYAPAAVPTIGAVLLGCTALYLVPRTSVLGALLLTGYLGGAVASQVRIGAPLFTILFPILFAILVWAGIYLRDGRLRALVPLRR